jgi:WD40 repeat protein
VSFAAVVERLRTLENPYPGLRPFETHESHLFFGRDQQVAELVSRLERNRLLAIVGLSGSGKSSLVRAGLIPALERGGVLEAGRRWRTVIARPAGAPFESLGAELTRTGLDASRLRQSSYGLIEVARQLPADESLLVLVDQFEELFRYKDLEPISTDARRRHAQLASDAAEFVQVLLSASRHYPPIYVVLTMRSDYLGDCAEFRDLPEALNDCQYLVPRLSREQRKEAIQAPLGRVEIAPNLVQRMLNDAGDEPDQLPVLQHALMRTWSRWRQSDPDQTRRIEVQDYDAIGGFSSALNQHADELLAGVSPAIAGAIFKRLTARGHGNRERRDPATVAELWAVCEAITPEQQAAVGAVIDRFRLGDATFLTPRAGAIGADTYIDITHESLIRQWKKLRDDWLPEERRSAKTFLDLAERARNWKAGKGETLVGLDLTEAAAWDRQRNKSAAWAAHYAEAEDLANTLTFIQASQANERKRTIRKWGLWIAAPLALLFAGLGLMALYQWAQAERARTVAENLRTVSLVRQLAAQSQLVQTEQPNLEPAMLLATEALTRLPMFESDRALRESASKLPRSVRFDDQPPVAAMTFSPDGRQLAILALGRSFVVSVFDTASRKEISRAADLSIQSIAPTSDGRWQAAAVRGSTVWTFEVPDKKEITRLSPQESVKSVTYAANGRYLVLVSDNFVRVVDAITGASIGQIPVQAGSASQSSDQRLVATVCPGRRLVATVSPDGRLIATGDADGNARVLDAASGNEVSSLAHKGSVCAVTFSQDGRWLATASEDNTARVVEAATGKEVARLTHQDRVLTVAFSADSRWVATGSEDRTARVFDAASGNEVARLFHEGPVQTVAFHPDGRRVATGTSNGAVAVFDRPSGMEISRLNDQSEQRRAMSGQSPAPAAIAPDGQRVAIGGVRRDPSPAVFNASSGEKIAPLLRDIAESVFSVAFSADGKSAVTGSGTDSNFFIELEENRRPSTLADDERGGSTRQGTARVFQASTWQQTMVVGSHGSFVHAVGLSADGRLLAVGRRGGAQVYDVPSGKERARLAHEASVNAIAFSRDAVWIVTGGSDETARVFRSDSGLEVARLPHEGRVEAVQFSDDGRWLATGGSDNVARVFDTGTWNRIAELTHQSAVTVLTFNDDGRYVATGSLDKTARVFETTTGKEVVRVSLDSRALDIRFMEHGRYLMAATVAASLERSQEIVLTRYMLRPSDLIDDACSRATRNLTRAEWERYVGTEVPYHKACAKLP